MIEVTKLLKINKKNNKNNKNKSIFYFFAANTMSLFAFKESCVCTTKQIYLNIVQKIFEVVRMLCTQCSFHCAP